VALGLGEFPDKTEAVQLRQTYCDITPTESFYCCLVRCGPLPLDFLDAGNRQPCVFLKEAKAVAPCNGGVLARIAGEDNPGLLLFGQFEDPGQVTLTEEAGFIDPDHLAADLFLEVLVSQEASDCISAGEAFLPEDAPAGLRGWREGEDLLATSLDERHGLFHQGCLAGAGLALNQHHAVARGEDMADGSLLLLVQARKVRFLATREEGAASASPFLCQDEQSAFLSQDLGSADERSAVHLASDQLAVCQFGTEGGWGDGTVTVAQGG
jgi:hypothetical protein